MSDCLRRELYFSPQNLHSRPPTLTNHMILGDIDSL
jgi:hypothetical protein